MTTASTGADLLRYTIEKEKFVVLDVEATSLNLFYAVPWQISFLVTCGKKIYKKFNLFPFFEDLKISSDAARISNFSHTEYKKNGQNPERVLKVLHHYLFNKEFNICGQNLLAYDIFILRNFYRKCGQISLFDYSFISRVYDTLALAKMYKLNLQCPQNKNDFLACQFKTLNQKTKGLKCSLENLAKEFDVKISENGQYHNALFDNYAAWGVFLKLINVLEIK